MGFPLRRVMTSDYGRAASSDPRASRRVDWDFRVSNPGAWHRIGSGTLRFDLCRLEDGRPLRLPAPGGRQRRWIHWRLPSCPCLTFRDYRGHGPTYAPPPRTVKVWWTPLPWGLFALRRLRRGEATNTGFTSPGCAAPSGFLNLLTLCSAPHRSSLVSCR